MPHTSQGLQSVAKKTFSTCPKITKRGHNICLNFVIRSKDYPSVVWNVCPWTPKDMSNGQGITCWKRVLKYSSLTISTFSYGILVACSSLPSSLALLYGSYMYIHVHVWCPHNLMVLTCDQVHFLSWFSFFGFYM